MLKRWLRKIIQQEIQKAFKEKAVAETTTYETIEEDLGNGRVRIYKQEVKTET